MKSAAQQPFLAKIRGALGSMHPAERRLGEFLCDFPGELASYNAQELARLANVSKATVSRFVRRPGYSNYEEARRHAREEQRSGSRLFLGHADEDGADSSLLAAIAQGKANLDQTFSTVTQAELDELSRLLLAARRTWIIGFRASHPLASYLRWQLTQAIENVEVIPRGGETLGENLASAVPDDIVILIGLRRRVAQTEQVMDYLATTKASVAYITDEGLEIDRRARWHFRCQTASNGPLFNHVSVMALCQFIAMRTIELAGSDGRARLRRIEMANDLLDEL